MSYESFPIISRKIVIVRCSLLYHQTFKYKSLQEKKGLHHVVSHYYLVFPFSDATHLAKEKAKADAEYYKQMKLTESNKVCACKY